MNKRIIALITSTILAFLILFPLRFALAIGGLSSFPVTARAAEGTVWSGHLRGVALDGIALGDFKVALSAVSFLKGRIAFNINSLGGEGAKAVVYSSPSGLGVDGLTAALAIPGAFDPLPIDAIELRDVAVSFSSGTCRTASGQVRLNLAAAIGTVPLGQQMMGTLRCDGTALLLPLASQSTLERARLRLISDGQYSTQLMLKPANPEDAQKLSAVGFRETPNGYAFEVSGKL
jgi:general secretion pathway protein N